MRIALNIVYLIQHFILEVSVFVSYGNEREKVRLYDKIIMNNSVLFYSVQNALVILVQRSKTFLSNTESKSLVSSTVVLMQLKSVIYRQSDFLYRGTV